MQTIWIYQGWYHAIPPLENDGVIPTCHRRLAMQLQFPHRRLARIHNLYAALGAHLNWLPQHLRRTIHINLNAHSSLRNQSRMGRWSGPGIDPYSHHNIHMLPNAKVLSRLTQGTWMLCECWDVYRTIGCLWTLEVLSCPGDNVGLPQSRCPTVAYGRCLQDSDRRRPQPRRRWKSTTTRLQLTKQRCSPFGRELLAAYLSVKHFRYYAEGGRLLVFKCWIWICDKAYVCTVLPVMQ